MNLWKWKWLLMSNKQNKKNKILKLTAIITVVIFAVLLYWVREPLGIQKILTNGNFDQTQDFVKFIDVGQADCALIYSNGYSALIDVGLPNTVNELSAEISECGIKTLDTVVISHHHADHVGALPEIANNFKIDNLIMPPLLEKSTSAAVKGKETAIENGSSYYEAVPGMNFDIGEFEITILSNFTDKSNENNRSLYVMAKINGIKFLFTGDAETKMENRLLDENLNIDCDVLKVSHHGSNTSSSKQFLNATTPEYAVISVGEDNIYSHPHKVTLDLLEKHSKIYRTDQDGDITFNVDKQELSIETEK